MSYCTKCGRKIDDEETGCIFCKSHEKSADYTNETKGKDYNYGRQDNGYSHQDYYAGYDNGGVKNNLTNGQKVTLVALVLILPGIGYIIGIILGIVFMNKIESDYRSFGKAILILSIIMISFSLLCCLMGVFSNIAFLNGFDSLYEDFYYNNDFNFMDIMPEVRWI